MKSTTGNRLRRRRPGRAALAKEPRVVRAVVERYRPTAAELRRQLEAAARADHGDNWSDYIDWSMLR